MLNMVVHIVTTGLYRVHTLSVGDDSRQPQSTVMLPISKEVWEDQNNHVAEATHGCLSRVYTLRQVAMYTALPYTCKYSKQLHGAALAGSI